MNLRNGAIVLSAVFCLFSCKAKMDLASTLSSIVGQSWVLDEMNGKKLDPANYEMKGLPTLNFETADKVVGSTGCNNFMANIKLTDNKFNVMPGPMTKMFCQGVDENGFMKALEESSTLKVEGDKLILSNGSEPKLSFNKK